MRVSCRKGDDGYTREFYRVFVDGVETNDVFRADDEQGWADRYRRVDGNLMRIAGPDGEGLEEERVFGVIRLERIEGAR